MSEIKNAIVTSYRLGLERGFAVTLWLDLDYGGAGQGFGGWVLHSTSRPDDGDRAGEYIANVLRVVGVEDLKDVVGKTIRVEASHNKVHRIGHIVKDDWFSPEEMFKGGQG